MNLYRVWYSTSRSVYVLAENITEAEEKFNQKFKRDYKLESIEVVSGFVLV